jgi:hypothetical protein
MRWMLGFGASGLGMSGILALSTGAAGSGEAFFVISCGGSGIGGAERRQAAVKLSRTQTALAM